MKRNEKLLEQCFPGHRNISLSEACFIWEQFDSICLYYDYTCSLYGSCLFGEGVDVDFLITHYYCPRTDHLTLLEKLKASLPEAKKIGNDYFDKARGVFGTTLFTSDKHIIDIVFREIKEVLTAYENPTKSKEIG